MEVYIIAIGVGLTVFSSLVTYLFFKAKLVGVQTSNNLLREQVDDLSKKLEGKTMAFDSLNSKYADVSNDLSVAGSKIAMLEEEKNNSINTLNTQLNYVKEELKNQTNEILKQREETLKKSNVEQLGNVLSPLREQIEEMKKRVDENTKTSSENKASFETAIKNLMTRTETISNDANNLAKALKNETKTQGNWGEMILETLLNNSGLKEGIHYHKQHTLRNSNGTIITHEETGSRLVPDIVVHYPDEKDCIIDSKVSLTAFIDYCNAENDKDKEEALAKHLLSIKNHVKELRKKDYSAHSQKAIKYTFMFVPNESALQVALQKDRTIWEDAFQSGICIVSEQNLLILLRMIQLVWLQVDQEENHKKILDQGGVMLDRLLAFINKFDDIDKKINNIRNSYDEAKKTLYSGNRSVVKAARKMEELGIELKPGNHLPQPSEIEN